MTRNERIRIFRPSVVRVRRHVAEQSFTDAAAKLTARQLESLAIQIERGAKPGGLTLDLRVVADLRDLLARSMLNAYWESASAVHYEILEARRLRQGKPEQVGFAAIQPGPESFYPEVGVDWYRSYSLRLAGVQQQAALERAKQIVAEGVERGLDNRAVIANLREVYPDFSKHRLENIARTEIAKIYEQARIQEMGGNDDIVGYEVAAILDTRTSEICRARNGRRFPKAQLPGNAPPYHFQCVLPGTALKAPCGIVAGLRSWYDGQAVELTFANGGRLAVTVNHLFPTVDGYAAAQHLRKGDYVLHCPDFEGIGTANPDADGIPTLAEDIVESLSETFGMSTMAVPVASEYFHGDGRFCDGNIDIVASDGFLRRANEALGFKHVAQKYFGSADVRAVTLTPERELAEVLFRWAHAADGIMGGRREALAFLRRSSGHADEVSLASVAKRDPALGKSEPDNILADAVANGKGANGHTRGVVVDDLLDGQTKPITTAKAESFTIRAEGDSTALEAHTDGFPVAIEHSADLVTGQAGFIEPLQVIDVKTFPFTGHVYDLQTLTSLYLANGVLSSNCRTVLLPIFRWEVEDGPVAWDPVPKTAPPVLPGFGTTDMTIPAVRDKAARRLIGQVERRG